MLRCIIVALLILLPCCSVWLKYPASSDIFLFSLYPSSKKNPVLVKNISTGIFSCPNKYFIRRNTVKLFISLYPKWILGPELVTKTVQKKLVFYFPIIASICRHPAQPALLDTEAVREYPFIYRLSKSNLLIQAVFGESAIIGNRIIII